MSVNATINDQFMEFGNIMNYDYTVSMRKAIWTNDQSLETYAAQNTTGLY